MELKTGKKDKTWAVSAYYNPMGYESRKKNFDVFKKHLKIPLLVVEFSHDGQFQIGEEDCDLLLQLSAGDVLWQKEALLNAGVTHLDETCENVVFLDADVVFPESTWFEKIDEMLEDKTLVQPFGYVLDLSQVETDQIRASGLIRNSMLERPAVDAVRTELDGFRLGFAKAWDDGELSEGYFTSWETRNVVPTAPGFGLAGKKALFEKYPLYDGAIIGGGDTLNWAAAVGEAQNVVSCLHLAGKYRSNYLAWADRFYNQVQGRVGYVPVPLLHLRHGSLADRRYYQRAEQLQALQYDPERDIVRSIEGIWKWSEDRKDLKAFAQQYFEARKEDQ